jgi:hypothetical protein
VTVPSDRTEYAAAIQAAREKLLATAMVAVLPTDATARLGMVLRLAEEAEGVLRRAVEGAN